MRPGEKISPPDPLGRVLEVRDLTIALPRFADRAQAAADGPGAAASGSITKLVLSEMSQQICELAFEHAGPTAAYWDGDAEPPQAHGLLDSRRLTIAGGTSEIQRNIIAERVLGLEREIDPQRGRPWRESRRG